MMKIFSGSGYPVTPPDTRCDWLVGGSLYKVRILLLIARSLNRIKINLDALSAGYGGG